MTQPRVPTTDVPDAIPKWLKWPVIVVVLLVYSVIYAIYGCLAWQRLGPDHAGVFGDMFGFLNAFVSGIAMLGVIAAILLQRQQNWMQSTELALQRQELADTRAELAGQRGELEKQNAHAANQLNIAMSRQQREVADYLQRNKPVVFCDLQRGGKFALRNVGGGFAINVYLIDNDSAEEPDRPIPLGSLAADDEQEVTPAINSRLLGSLTGRRFVIVAEAPFTRTTQWTATLNYRTPGDWSSAQVRHSFPELKTPPPRGEAQPLSKFLENNLPDLFEKLTQFTTGPEGG